MYGNFSLKRSLFPQLPRINFADVSEIKLQKAIQHASYNNNYQKGVR